MSKRRVAFVFALVTALAGCSSQQGSNTQTEGGPAPAKEDRVLSWTTNNKNAVENGNMQVAIALLSTSNALEKAEKTTAATLTKRIYACIGQPWKLSGEVYKVEELPPGTFEGNWTDVLMLSQNPNSPAGVTTVEFVYRGDSSQVNAGETIEACGFLLGSYESQNALGGTVEGLMLAGNSFKKL